MSNHQHFSAAEYCDRLKYEFEMLQNQYNLQKIDLEKAKAEKQDLIQLSKKYYEMAYFLNIQNHKHALINSRLLAIINDAIKLLPQDSQSFVQEGLEEAKKVTIADIEKRIKILQSQPNQKDLDPFSDEILVGGAATSSLNNSSSSSSQQQIAEPQVVSGATSSAAKDLLSDAAQNITNVEMEDAQAAPPVIPSGENSADQSSTSPKPHSVNNNNNNGSEDAAMSGVNAPSSDAEKREAAALAAAAGKQAPRRMKQRNVFPHDYSVSALFFNRAGDRLLTGSRGTVKVWNVNSDSSKPAIDIECFKNNYIRSCKLTTDENTLLVCGETKEIVLVDMGQGGAPVQKAKLETNVDFHYGLSITPDDKYVFSCFSNGQVGMWDLASNKLVRTFKGHTDSVSCIDLASNGNVLMTGSLDQTVRAFDWTTETVIQTYDFPCQIFTLGIMPGSSTIAAVGLENSYVEIINTEQPKSKYELHLHESCVLSLAFAPNGEWFATGGKDKFLHVWKAPYGPGVTRTKEPNSILSCLVSPKADMICTGSWEKKCTLYDVCYEN